MRVRRTVAWGWDKIVVWLFVGLRHCHIFGFQPRDSVYKLECVCANVYIYLCKHDKSFAPPRSRNSWRNRDPLDGNRRVFNYREIDGKSTSVWFDIVSVLRRCICDSVRVENVPPSLMVSAQKYNNTFNTICIYYV